MQDLQIVGRPAPRLDGVRKVTGRAKYSVDIRHHGMLFGKLLRSPYPHARILAIDTSAASQIPGVRAIVTGQDVTTGLWGSGIKDQPVLPRDRVRYVGEPVAAVAADDEATAERACEAIVVEYEELPAALDIESALAPGAPLVHDAAADYALRPTMCRPVNGTNILNHNLIRKGDPDRAFREPGVVVISGTYTTQAQQHVALEPHASLAEWDPDGRLHVWTGTQAPFLVRNDLALALRMDPSRIRVTCLDVGGGFGGKIHLRLEPYCALLSKAAGRPVKMVYTRHEVFIGSTYRHPARIEITTAARRDGTLVGARIKTYFDTGAYSDSGESVAWQTALGGVGPYRVPNLHVDTYAVYTHKLPSGAFRGMGWPQITWAFESQMDELAERLQMDPLELRLKNAYREGDVTGTGEVLKHVTVVECLERAAKEIGWGRPLPSNRGLGISVVMKSSVPLTTAGAFVKIAEDGRAQLITGAAEIGTGVQTTMAQICAEGLGVPVEHVVVSTADTDYSPHDNGAISDRTTFHLGSAVRDAALSARQQLLEAAAEIFKAPPESLRIQEGIITRQGDSDRKVTVKDVVAYCHSRKGGPILGIGRRQQEDIVPMDPETGQSPRPASHYKFGAQAVEVEVDPETGRLSIVRVVSVHDVGQVINPLNATGQVEGAVAQGVGFALLEEMKFDGGAVVNGSLMEYSVPTVMDVPPTQVVLLENPYPGGPYGAKGAGEPGIIGVAAAVGNALKHATGVRIYDLPLTWERVAFAIAEKEQTERETALASHR